MKPAAPTEDARSVTDLAPPSIPVGHPVRGGVVERLVGPSTRSCSTTIQPSYPRFSSSSRHRTRRRRRFRAGRTRPAPRPPPGRRRSSCTRLSVRVRSTSLKWTWFTRSPYSCRNSSGSPPPKALWPVSKHSPSGIGIDRLDHPVDLARGLDIGARVIVQRNREAAFAAAGRGQLKVCDQKLEPIVREPGLGVILDRPGELHPVGLDERVGEQHHRQARAARRGSSVSSARIHRRQVLDKAVGTREPQRQERAHQLEPMAREQLADRRAGAEVAREAQLGADVAGLAP